MQSPEIWSSKNVEPPKRYQPKSPYSQCIRPKPDEAVRTLLYMSRRWKGYAPELAPGFDDLPYKDFVFAVEDGWDFLWRSDKEEVQEQFRESHFYLIAIYRREQTNTPDPKYKGIFQLETSLRYVFIGKCGTRCNAKGKYPLDVYPTGYIVYFYPNQTPLALFTLEQGRLIETSYFWDEEGKILERRPAGANETAARVWIPIDRQYSKPRNWFGEYFRVPKKIKKDKIKQDKKLLKSRRKESLNSVAFSSVHKKEPLPPGDKRLFSI